MKYALIFVLGHYLFLKAHSFPRATLSENCSLLGTGNVQGQISWHIFEPNGGYCVLVHSLLSSAKEEREMAKFCVVRGKRTTTTNFSYCHLELNVITSYLA